MLAERDTVFSTGGGDGVPSFCQHCFVCVVFWRAPFLPGAGTCPDVFELAVQQSYIGSCLHHVGISSWGFSLCYSTVAEGIKRCQIRLSKSKLLGDQYRHSLHRVAQTGWNYCSAAPFLPE